MDPPLAAHHMKSEGFPGEKNVLDGFLEILWIKLVIKIRYLDCIRQEEIKRSCGHLKT